MVASRLNCYYCVTDGRTIMDRQHLGRLITLYDNYKWIESQLLSVEGKFEIMASKELVKEWKEEKLRMDNTEWRRIE